MPFRFGAARLKRGSLLRNICIAIIKPFSRNKSLLKNLKEIRPADHPQLSFEPTDSMVAAAIFWFGVQGYEGVLAKIWVDLCQKSENILEIGGNIGLYSVIGGGAARGNYTVVEPVPVIADVLESNLKRNNVTRVNVLRGAVVPGDVESIVKLNIPSEGRECPVGAHLTLDSEVSGRTSQTIIDVRGVPVCSLVKGCDLIKIDAEGLEFALLSAAAEILKKKKPTIVIEVLAESVLLGKLIASLATECNYFIHVVPEYGTDQIFVISPDGFSSSVPQSLNSKDVILCTHSLENTVFIN